MDGFTVSISDVVDVWELSEICQLEGLKLCFMGSLENSEGNEVSRILDEAEELSSPCDELKLCCKEILKRPKAVSTE